MTDSGAEESSSSSITIFNSYKDHFLFDFQFCWSEKAKLKQLDYFSCLDNSSLINQSIKVKLLFRYYKYNCNIFNTDL